MKLINGIYVLEIYSTLLQKNTLQLNKFIHSLDLTDIEGMFDDYEEQIFEEAIEFYNQGKIIEFILTRFPNHMIAKVYKAKFYDFKKSLENIDYKTDYNNLTSFYKIATDHQELLRIVNDEAYFMMQSEISNENIKNHEY